MSQALRGTICPDTVLLFEPRIDYPALRVTAMKLLFENGRLYCEFTQNLAKKLKISIFSLFSFFSQKFCVSCSRFRPLNNLQILDVNSSFDPSHRDLPGNEIKLKIERMELNQKLTFQRKCYKFVASPLRHDLPEHCITLRAED